MTMNDRIEWVAHHILPHEAALRRWLSRFVAPQDVEDIVQEAYCSIAGLDVLAHIVDPKRYLFQVARNVVMANLRRARVVQIDSIGGLQEIERVIAHDESNNPERLAADRALLRQIDDALASMSERSRTVFRLRRLQGLSQRDVARRLGVSEAVVENELARGLKQILSSLGSSARRDVVELTKGHANAQRR